MQLLQDAKGDRTLDQSPEHVNGKDEKLCGQPIASLEASALPDWGIRVLAEDSRMARQQVMLIRLFYLVS